MIINKLIEVRLLSAVLAFELAKGMLTSGMWMLQEESMMGRIAKLSSFPEIFAYVWMSLALLVVPYLVLQVVGFKRSHQRIITRLACWATLTSGVFWVYLAYISKNLDYSNITEIFLLHGTTCVATAALLAYSLNIAQRELREEPT